eukprot:CAMPEP_0172926994 /NCGR_PEP_ID=MMETSP1075-20121228/216664_1 /TAXON_ID=2916 /ORGANISM="Ceratium fusus, Strain PA161109" /LENGTH=194 /DNA_ID=CAMNT_0013788169 /DNA_START=107 /DNA_END=690 /DNA_ORIENTATION=-
MTLTLSPETDFVAGSNLFVDLNERFFGERVAVALVGATFDLLGVFAMCSIVVCEVGLSRGIPVVSLPALVASPILASHVAEAVGEQSPPRLLCDVAKSLTAKLMENNPVDAPVHLFATVSRGLHPVVCPNLETLTAQPYLHSSQQRWQPRSVKVVDHMMTWHSQSLPVQTLYHVEARPWAIFLAGVLAPVLNGL